MGKRRQPATVEQWEQLELLLNFPEQRTYELIRPIVLFGQTPAARAVETGVPAYTLRRKAKRFAAQGMASLFDTPPPPPAHVPPSLPQAIPPKLRQLIIDLKVEHPPLRVHEIQTICYARTGRRPHATTVARILEEAAPLPPRRTRRFLPYHQIPEPTHRRAAIVRLHIEGWVKKAIADYLETSRETVHATLRRWVAEGVGGLYPKSRAPKRRHPKATLRIIHEIRKLQRNPRLGEFRVHARLKQLGIYLSPRTCGRVLAMNRKLYAELRTETEPEEHKKKRMPFAATKRHQFWTVDIRYLDMHQLGGGMVYAITILENYSRAVLASAVTRTQDMGAY